MFWWRKTFRFVEIFGRPKIWPIKPSNYFSNITKQPRFVPLFYEPYSIRGMTLVGHLCNYTILFSCFPEGTQLPDIVSQRFFTDHVFAEAVELCSAVSSTFPTLASPTAVMLGPNQWKVSSQVGNSMVALSTGHAQPPSTVNCCPPLGMRNFIACCQRYAS